MRAAMRARRPRSAASVGRRTSRSGTVPAPPGCGEDELECDGGTAAAQPPVRARPRGVEVEKGVRLVEGCLKLCALRSTTLMNRPVTRPRQAVRHAASPVLLNRPERLQERHQAHESVRRLDDRLERVGPTPLSSRRTATASPVSAAVAASIRDRRRSSVQAARCSSSHSREGPPAPTRSPLRRRPLLSGSQPETERSERGEPATRGRPPTPIARAPLPHAPPAGPPGSVMAPTPMQTGPRTTKNCVPSVT